MDLSVFFLLTVIYNKLKYKIYTKNHECFKLYLTICVMNNIIFIIKNYTCFKHGWFFKKTNGRLQVFIFITLNS